MSYLWGTSTFAEPEFLGQVQVDQLGACWQWETGAVKAWVRRPELELKESQSAVIYAVGRSQGSFPADRQQDLFGNHLFTAFSHSFLSVESSSDPSVVYGRIAHVADEAEWGAYLSTVVPSSGGSYDVDFRVRVLEAYDPRIRPNRVHGWNALYGAMRGRAAYKRSKGRYQIGLPVSAGVDPKFYGWTGAEELSVQLLRRFLGVEPSSSNDLAVWFSRRRCELFSMPRNEGAIFVPQYTDRRCWNTAAGAWENIPSGVVWESANGPSANNPALIWTQFAESTVGVGDPSVLRGVRFFRYQVQAVMAYHLVAQGSSNLHAFYVKPMGATHQALDLSLSDAEWGLWSVARYRGDSDSARYISVPFENRVLTPGGGSGGWRFALHDAVPSGPRNSNGWGADSDRIPRTLNFYVKNNITGVRSPVFPGGIEIVRRHNNTPMAFYERRG